MPTCLLLSIRQIGQEAYLKDCPCRPIADWPFSVQPKFPKPTLGGLIREGVDDHRHMRPAATKTCIRSSATPMRWQDASDPVEAGIQQYLSVRGQFDDPSAAQ